MRRSVKLSWLWYTWLVGFAAVFCLSVVLLTPCRGEPDSLYKPIWVSYVRYKEDQSKKRKTTRKTNTRDLQTSFWTSLGAILSDLDRTNAKSSGIDPLTFSDSSGPWIRAWSQKIKNWKFDIVKSSRLFKYKESAYLHLNWLGCDWLAYLSLQQVFTLFQSLVHHSLAGEDGLWRQADKQADRQSPGRYSQACQT